MHCTLPKLSVIRILFAGLFIFTFFTFLLLLVWTNKRLCSNFITVNATMENSMKIILKIRTELSYYLATSCLSAYLKNIKILIQNNTCTPMFVVALFTIAQI